MTDNPSGPSANNQKSQKIKNNDGFPRSKNLPTQSPLFWVQQKDRYLRQLLIRDIEETTKRRLIIYFSNRFAGALIDAGDISYMAELIGDLGSEPVDVLLETNGGQTDATEALVNLIQNAISDFRVVVTKAAKSNGTLLALAANEIVMGPTSELGPIEPLVNGLPCSILTQDEIKKQNYPLHMYGVYALQQSRTLAQTLLRKGMMAGSDETKISSAVQALSSRDTYFSHGSVINHVEASALGLKVKYLSTDDDLWQRLWLLSAMVEYDANKSRYLKLFEGRARSTAVSIPATSAHNSIPS